VSVRVLTWNLFHGRSVPDTPRELLAEFAATLAGWAWDVALLQEVPPWWPPALGAASGALAFRAPTSRNQLPALRRALATRRPDLMRSAGGGANAILVRDHRVLEHRRRRMALWPERRVLHAVRRDDGLWIANLHASAHDAARAERELAASAAVLRRWTGAAPVLIGADCNTRRPRLPGFTHAGGHVLDHVFARGLEPVGPAELPERGGLSDHVPVLVALAPPSR
jgi:endonuclease/exonuclease/phosphatase family metal-dependent hydrolase